MLGARLMTAAAAVAEERRGGAVDQRQVADRPPRDRAAEVGRRAVGGVHVEREVRRGQDLRPRVEPALEVASRDSPALRSRTPALTPRPLQASAPSQCPLDLPLGRVRSCADGAPRDDAYGAASDRSAASATNASSAAGSASESRLATRSDDSPRRIRLTGASSFLPVSVRGIAGTDDDRVGHVPRRQLAAERGRRSRRGARRRARRPSAGTTNSSSSPAPPPASSRCTTSASMHLGHVLDHGVELAGAEPHAAAVERRVGAAGDHAAAALGEHDPVALAPHAGVDVEVGRAVALAVLVSPERHRHRRHRLGDHQLAELADHLVAVGVERVRVDAQARPGDLALVHRLGEAARHEPGAHVGPAGAVVQQQLGAELLVHVQVALRRAAASRPCTACGCCSGRTRARAGARPCGTPSGTRGATPITVGCSSSASRHCSSRSGHAGSPSSITIDERSSSPATSAFHIIHAVVENHSSRPPGLRSQPSPRFLWCSISWPPWPWTIAFGSPVVPEENSTYSGWSNGTASNSSGAALGGQLLPRDRVRDLRLPERDPDHVLDRRESGRGSSRPRRGGRRSGRGSRSRRRPAARAARSARSGRSRCGRRTRARTWPRSRRGSRWR